MNLLKINSIIDIQDDDIENSLIKFRATTSNDQVFIITLHNFALTHPSDTESPVLEFKCDTSISLTPEDENEMEKQIKRIILYIISEDLNHEST